MALGVGSDGRIRARSLGDLGLRLSSPGDPILPYQPRPPVVKMCGQAGCLEDQRPKTNRHQRSCSWVSISSFQQMFSEGILLPEEGLLVVRVFGAEPSVIPAFLLGMGSPHECQPSEARGTVLYPQHLAKS